jgi:hypothetical protein
MIVNGSNLLNAKLSDYLNCLNILFRHLNQANFKYMIELNDFIENVNIYREMAIAFLRSIFINENDESIKEKFNQLILNDFDLNKTNLTFTQTLLLEYLIKLLNSFYKTKSLKELSRFNIRKHISICNNRNFNFVVKRIQGVPKSLKLYLLYENT